MKKDEWVSYGEICKMNSLEESKLRITVLFSKVRLLRQQTMEYKTDYTYANIHLLICHGSANIIQNARNVNIASRCRKHLE